MDYKELRQKYPEFGYEKFEISQINDDIKIQFFFDVGPDIHFTPFVIIKNLKSGNLEELNVFAFNLGMVELLSYWKATYSPVLKVRCGSLDEWQISWWKKLYTKGLSQYFFENHIDYKNDSFEIKPESDVKFEKKSAPLSDSVLLAFSGGVDSTLSLEILSKNNIETTLFMMNSTVSTMEIAEEYKDIKQIIVKRGIDPDLIDLNNRGYLNGHTPFSAYLAFLGSMVAYLSGNKYLIFSNERSSNEANAKYLDEDVNHQYSKTFEFENDYREYSEKYLTNIEYFSLLRPLYNLQITKLFASLKKHFTMVKSCNVNQKSGTWCLTCPKCLSTFILLYPFLSEEEVLGIFEGNIYKDTGLFELLTTLVDKDKVKPFECVGTREEIMAGLYLSIQKNTGKELPPLLKKANEETIPKANNLNSQASEILDSWNTDNNLPKAYETILRNQIR